MLCSCEHGRVRTGSNQPTAILLSTAFPCLRLDPADRARLPSEQVINHCTDYSNLALHDLWLGVP